MIRLHQRKEMVGHQWVRFNVRQICFVFLARDQNVDFVRLQIMLQLIMVQCFDIKLNIRIQLVEPANSNWNFLTVKRRIRKADRNGVLFRVTSLLNFLNRQVIPVDQRFNLDEFTLQVQQNDQ